MVYTYDFKTKKTVVIQIISTLNFLSTKLLLCCATESLTSMILFTRLNVLYTIFIWIHPQDKMCQIRECQKVLYQDFEYHTQSTH